MVYNRLLFKSIQFISMFDFSKLSTTSAATPTTDPRSIFQTLPKQNPEKYEYPRDVQSQVWNRWHSRRNERSLVIKLNTGSGKTTVGLCILQSCLNEKKGPSVYVAPSPFLVSQVIAEATALGIKTTESEKDRDFISGEAILICNIHKLVNGRSVFGVGSKKINIGSIIFDDAHACMSTINEQFSINIPDGTQCYKKLFELFSDSLRQQSESRSISVRQGDPLASQRVPYWAWQSSMSEVHAILAESKNEEHLQWQYPLLNEKLELCECIIGSKNIEISTRIIPIDVIPSITDAERKLFMTATLSDDSILSSHFGVESESLGTPITPDTAGDIGERMILSPQEIISSITDSNMKEICKNLSSNYNVVVIVPSNKRALFWVDVADRTLTKENINEGIEHLHSNPKSGLTILINRYDGIDLPGDACRVLVIDGLPEYKSLAERTAEVDLRDSSLGHRDFMHKIEQGMGRGIRSNSDYCVVLLMGIDLISKLYLEKATEFFSPCTKKQLELSKNLTRQLRAGSPTIQSILDTMDACLKRNPEWISVAKNELVGLTFDNHQSTDSVIPTMRKAYDLFFTIQASAIEIINDIDRLDNFDSSYKGYLKQITAQYVHLVDPDRAQKIQQSAIRLNNRLLKPIQGVQRRPLNRDQEDQALNVKNYLQDKYSDGNEVVLACQQIINNLNFSVDHNKFEKALSDAGRFIGFNTQLPDTDTGTGPDVFWYLGPNWSFVIECKNNAVSSSISKEYCNQLSGHIQWHESLYSMCKRPIPVMIHSASTIGDISSVPAGMQLFNSSKLDQFKKNLQSYAAALSEGEKYRQAPQISSLLSSYNFFPDRFANEYFYPI